MSENNVNINIGCYLENQKELDNLLMELSETIKMANALSKRLADFCLTIDVQK